MRDLIVHLPIRLRPLAASLYGSWLDHHRKGNNYNSILSYYIDNLNHLEINESIELISAQIKNHPCNSFLTELLDSGTLTDKRFVLSNYKKFFDESSMISMLKTSGTTGSGFKIPVSKGFLNNQWAVFEKHRIKLGIPTFEWKAVFTGQRFASLDEQMYSLDVRSMRQTFFSQYHLNAETVKHYIDGVKKRNIRWIHGYPSFVTELIRLAEISNSYEDLSKLGVKWVTLSSETISDNQRKIIKNAFGAEIFGLYGLTEGVANIFECKHHSLHVDERFSFVEFRRSEREDIDGYSEIIGTTYHNPALPLIRYKTGDYCLFSEDDKCTCGDAGRVVRKIYGRMDDYIILRNGTRIGRLDHLFKGMTQIFSAQLIQDEPGKAVCFLTLSADANESLTLAAISSSKRLILGDDFDLSYKIVDEIPKSNNAKHRFIIQNIQ